MDEWWERRWLRRHAMVAPFGILATTFLLTYWMQQRQWQWPADLDKAAGLVDIGAVIYAAIAVAVERGVNMIFWALEERKKRQERREKQEAEALAKARAKGLAEGLAEGHAEGLAEGHAEGHAEGYSEARREFDAQLERVAQEAREKGITLDELPPPVK